MAAALLGAATALIALLRGTIETAQLAGVLPELALRLRLDPLAAFFLIPIHVLGAVGTLYGLRYWRQADHPVNGRKLRLCFGVLIAALAAVVLAADGVAFLLAWEVMALSAFLLVTTEDERAAVQEAGWVYLVATHAGTLALFALFALLWAITGSLEFRTWPSGASAPAATGVLFLLALFAFGL
ncbi:MAG TPA: proton-conducting transporter membrane subunit, partial [Myxococcota bacterium]|nr:proton-conducting transporter membrane subunit [Myxococcota bacterium]